MHDHFEAKIKVGISLVRGTMDMKFAISEKRDQNHARLVADGSGAGSKMHIDSVIDLTPDPEGTKMTWAADADISGLMAGIGSQILEGPERKTGQPNLLQYQTKDRIALKQSDILCRQEKEPRNESGAL